MRSCHRRLERLKQAVEPEDWREYCAQHGLSERVVAEEALRAIDAGEYDAPPAELEELRAAVLEILEELAEAGR